ncbi:MAG TPA: hypothetical protein VFE12_22870 [Acetobacteraceae bacterium]|jgi:hypothetical protein|nr:hypothetical protein [Acetobacteraceae bacterium]
MKWLLAGCAVAALSSGAAWAGPCAQQITALQRTLSSQDAGSGPVQASQDNAASRQASEAGSSTRATSEASRSPAEVGTSAQGQGGDRAGPTGTMNRATAGSAASAQDVRLQQQGRPTQAEAARNGTPDAARGDDKLQKVAADLERARSLDRKNDSSCLSAVDAAKKDLATD